jgi:hypothetical protein
MSSNDNIYISFVRDSENSLNDLRCEFNRLGREIKKLSLDETFESKVLEDAERQRILKKLIDEILSLRLSLKIQCLLSSGKSKRVSGEAKGLGFHSNSEFASYLIDFMKECGLTYRNDVVDIIRRFYLMSDYENKDFNLSIGNKVNKSILLKKSLHKKTDI